MQSPASHVRPGLVPALWITRAMWLGVAVFGGPGFGEALATHSRPVQLTGTVLLWVGWGAVAGTLVLPSAHGLTVSRMLTPIGVVAASAALLHAGASPGTIVALASTAVVTLVTMSGEYGQSMVQASAYGDEQRFLLRPPATFLVPTLVSWAVWCTAMLVGPLALAARGWPAGVPLTASAIAGGWFLAPRFHRLSRRWVVLVPAGFVLHDHVVLAETVMFRTEQITRARLALADTQAADLTGPAGGHAVEVTIADTDTVVLAGTRDRPNGAALHVRAFLCAPTRPGKVLLAAAGRRLPVG